MHELINVFPFAAVSCYASYLRNVEYLHSRWSIKGSVTSPPPGYLQSSACFSISHIGDRVKCPAPCLRAGPVWGPNTQALPSSAVERVWRAIPKVWGELDPPLTCRRTRLGRTMVSGVCRPHVGCRHLCVDTHSLIGVRGTARAHGSNTERLREPYVVVVVGRHTAEAPCTTRSSASSLHR